MTWRLRITASAVAVCLVLCLMVGGIAAYDTLTRHHDIWWIAAVFLIPSVVALIGIYASDDDA